MWLNFMNFSCHHIVVLDQIFDYHCLRLMSRMEGCVRELEIPKLDIVYFPDDFETVTSLMTLLIVKSYDYHLLLDI